MGVGDIHDDEAMWQKRRNMADRLRAEESASGIPKPRWHYHPEHDVLSDTEQPPLCTGHHHEESQQ